MEMSSSRQVTVTQSLEALTEIVLDKQPTLKLLLSLKRYQLSAITCPIHEKHLIGHLSHVCTNQTKFELDWVKMYSECTLHCLSSVMTKTLK